MSLSNNPANLKPRDRVFIRYDRSNPSELPNKICWDWYEVLDFSMRGYPRLKTPFKPRVKPFNIVAICRYLGNEKWGEREQWNPFE